MFFNLMSRFSNQLNKIQFVPFSETVMFLSFFFFTICSSKTDFCNYLVIHRQEIVIRSLYNTSEIVENTEEIILGTI